MNKESIINKLKHIIAEDLEVNLTVKDIDEKADLLKNGLGIDSLAIVELISLIEQYFIMEFSEEDIKPENFKNLQILATLIESKNKH
jgi:acyl carrier protein